MKIFGSHTIYALASIALLALTLPSTQVNAQSTDPLTTSSSPNTAGLANSSTMDVPLNSQQNGDFFYLDGMKNFIGLGDANPLLIVTKLISVFLGVLGVIFLVLIIYAGFLWLVSAGREENTKAARQTIVNAIIGMFIILVSYSLVTFVINTLAESTGAPPLQ